MEDPEKDRGVNEEPGVGWRVSLSILGGVGWLAFLIVWLFFFAADYTGYQNVAILLLSLLVAGAVAGMPWAVWGWRHRTPREMAMNKTPGFRWRVAASALMACLLLAFLIVWLFFFAGDYSIYRNLAVLLVAVLLFGGIQGAMWAPWGMRHGDDFGEEGGER
ncbi:MAG: hypothetical protein PHU95_03430 [Candidatus Thermoplasmatota archaeon]|nr:hypothetical protein [Candidatus Thermoplasmatota archaeon]MDD5778481.1 hypothetical protein [Candidatus Thermoplasmatota archaeon]